MHVAPQAGAGFTQITVEFEPGGRLTQGPTQRFLYVLDGDLTLTERVTQTRHLLTAGSYAYCPADHAHDIVAEIQARLVLIEKPFEQPPAGYPQATHARETELQPSFFIGCEQNVPSTPLNGDDALQVRSLLPASLAFDFACNTMTYQPGASLSQVEIHYMEHGLLMLEGGGIYRLGDCWYPTQAGDFIWMAPFCPQWFCALGKQPAKYLIYKDFNRHPLG